MEISNLQPNAIWQHFIALNAIPRASKKEERVIEFMVDFGNKLGLSTQKDAAGNVIIKKSATKGMEHGPTVILQSHLDMVHQKNNDTIFDFDTEGIKMYVDGDWVKANGTTLGADNGIGVASIMAILSSDSIEHLAIEALFTIDEETGMTGAKNLDDSILNGSILLNLDTEDDTEITIGCAGGIDITATTNYQPFQLDADSFKAIEIKVSGLNGGHSGMEIHMGLGNANKIMNRILYAINEIGKVYIHSINGGGLRNAIPRESNAIVLVEKNNVPTIEKIISETTQLIKNEIATVDPDLNIVCKYMDASQNFEVVPYEQGIQLIKSIYAAPNGVYKMSSDFENLVETSNNIASVQVDKGVITIKCLTRSSVNSSKLDLANAIRSSFELMGASVTYSGDYPGWSPNAASKALQVVKEAYSKTFNAQAHVAACHAGLECGILAGHYPNLDMVSFGPTILGAHSPDERVSISSVQKFWELLKAVLIELRKQ